MKSESPKTIQITVKLPQDSYEAVQKYASKEHRTVSDIVRSFVDKGLNIKTYEEEIDLISGILRNEIEIAIKAQTNRLAGLINRLTIISAAGYYANIAIISDLIDTDRYSSFEKIESIARKKALAYANTKNVDAIKTFADDEEMKKAISDLKGGVPKYVDFNV